MASYPRGPYPPPRDDHFPWRLQPPKPPREYPSPNSRSQQIGLHEPTSYGQSPPSLLVSNKTPLRPRSNPNIKVKRIWPPSPAVEDEKMSLARELNPAPIDDDTCSEAQSRGTLDQTPIILGLDDLWDDIEAQLQASDSSLNEANAFHSGDPVESLSSRSGKHTRHWPDISPIDSDIPASPMLSQRQSSPYAFTPKTFEYSRTIDTDTDSLASSKDTFPPRRVSQEFKEQKKVKARESLSTKALCGNGRMRNRAGSTSRSTTRSLDGAVEEYDSSSSLNGSRSSGHQSSVCIDRHGRERRNFVSENARTDDSQPRLSQLRAEALERTRRISEPIFVRPRFDAASSYTTPTRRTPETAFTFPPVTTPMSAKSFNNHTSPRQVSPDQSQAIISPPSSPPDSPRIIPFKHRDGSPRSGRSTAPNSRTPSRPPSPAVSTPPPKHDESLRRSSTFPLVEDEKSRVPSRLPSSSLKSNDNVTLPYVHAFTPASAFNVAGSLPYPIAEAEIPTMPWEDDHKFQSQPMNSRSMASQTMPNLPQSYQSAYTQHIPSRPKMGSRHTFPGQYPGMVVSSVPRSVRTASMSSNPMLVNRMPNVPCPRPQLVWGYDDWCTLDGYSSFDICPTCFEASFWNSSFRHCFKRAAPKDPNRGTKCDFGSPWMRMAWLLTVQQGRKSLDLLYAVAAIDAAEATCPGAKDEIRYWYTLVDNSCNTIDTFDICLCDVEKLKALLPSLRGFFKRSSNTGERRRCDFRSNSTRFRDYLDLLIEIDDEAYRKKADPELSRFVKFVEQKSDLPECQRDIPLRNDYWHSASSLPEFTVCEDCYHSVIHPAKRRGSSVARRFGSTPVRISHEGSKGRRRSSTTSGLGTSCQLYSPRMRAIFDAAVEEGDFHFLADKARQRKETETDLRQRKLNLLFAEDKVIDTLAKAGVRSDWRNQPGYGWLKRDFERLSEDWRAWE